MNVWLVVPSRETLAGVIVTYAAVEFEQTAESIPIDRASGGVDEGSGSGRATDP